MSVSDVVGLLALAMLQSALVALPRAGALAPLARMRSPAWAAVLPATIVIGTFTPLWHHCLATVLVIAAAVVTPLLAIVAIVAVARTPRALLVTGPALALALAAVISRATAGQLTISLVTGLGCLSLGVALARLIPRKWLIIGVVLMAAVDVLLLASGVGEAAAGSMARASADFHGPQFTQAAVGGDTIDYPDLVLAGVLGGAVAGEPTQRRAAVTLALLAPAWDSLLAVVRLVPATVPIALTLVLLAVWQRAPVSRLRRGSAASVKARADGPMRSACIPHCSCTPAWQPAPCGCT
jgi:hypothetical protein